MFRLTWNIVYHCYLTRFFLPDGQQATFAVERVYTVKRGFIYKAAGQEKGEQDSESRLPGKQGAQGIYGIKNKEAGQSGAWGMWGKVIGKRCNSNHSAQV